MVRKLTVVQMLPALESGGVERGTLELAAELVRQGQRSIVVSAGGRLVERLTSEGSEHLAWDVGHKRLWTFRHVWRLRRFLRDNHVDILHLRSRLPAWIGYLAWKGMPEDARPHLVTTVHGPYSVNRYSAVMTKGERVIAVSEMIRDYITNNYPDVDPEVIRVIHRGVDPREFPYGYQPPEEWLAAWYAQFPATRGKPLVVLPGRLTRWKGQEAFIEIMRSLKERGIEVHGLIVGDAHPRRRAFEEELKQKVGEAGLDAWITFTGHRSDIREIMALADIVLSLSSEPEAFGRTTLEALSLGTPVAGYDHGGVAEQLRAIFPQGLVELDDLAGVEERIAAWLQERPLVPQEHPFTLDAMRQATLSVYRELVGGL